MVSFVADFNSLDPSFTDNVNPLSDIPSLADDIKMLSEKLGEVLGQEGTTILGKMDSLSTAMEGKFAELKEIWEARIKVAEEEVRDLKVQIKVKEGKEPASPWFSSRSTDAAIHSDKPIDMRMLDGITGWTGPSQMLFLEWAWSFAINLSGARRGFGKAARWANRAADLDTPIADRDRSDFSIGYFVRLGFRKLVFCS